VKIGDRIVFAARPDQVQWDDQKEPVQFTAVVRRTAPRVSVRIQVPAEYAGRILRLDRRIVTRPVASTYSVIKKG
jgi:hypothetical protein